MTSTTEFRARLATSPPRSFGLIKTNNSRPMPLVCFEGAGTRRAPWFIGDMLGHTQMQSYVHLVRAPIWNATARVTGSGDGILSFDQVARTAFPQSPRFLSSLPPHTTSVTPHPAPAFLSAHPHLHFLNHPRCYFANHLHRSLVVLLYLPVLLALPEIPNFVTLVLH